LRPQRTPQMPLVARSRHAYDPKVMRGVRLGVMLSVCAAALGAGRGQQAQAAPAPPPATSDPAPPAESGSPEAALPLGAEGQAPEAAPPGTRITCLDDLSPEGQQRKGVQKRDFLKRHKFEMSALGGLLAADALSSTYALAGSFAFFPAEDFGLELLVAHSPAQFRLEEPFVGFDQPRRFTPGSAFSVLGALLFSPVHAKFKFSEATIVHGDLFIVLGAGRTLHESVQGVTFQAGIGLRLYLMSRLAFRIEVRDLVMPQEVLGVGRVTHNITVLGGFGFWLG
jgi:outer membrane beta-barrel protein